MEPFTYVMIVALASWTVGLMYATRWSDKYIRAAWKYEAKSKELFAAQQVLNASLASQRDAEEKLYATLQKEIAGYEADRAHLTELEAERKRLHEELNQKLVLLSDANAECLALIIAHATATTNEYDLDVGRQILASLQAQWPRYEWRALVRKYLEGT